MTLRQFFIGFSIIKVFACVVAILGVSQIVQLGDTPAYLAGAHNDRDGFISSTYLMSISGSFFFNFFRVDLLANLPAALLSVYCTCYVVKNITLTNVQRLAFFSLMCSPTYLLWTSIHSKEAIVSSAFATFSACVIRSLKERRITIRLVELTAILVVFLFKPHFALPVVVMMLFIVVNVSRVKGKVWLNIAFFIFIFLAISFGFWFLRDHVFNIASGFHRHFSPSGTYTRGIFWGDFQDFLSGIPAGLVFSFVGPTIFEADDSPVLMAMLIHGMFLLFVFLVLSFKSFLKIKALRLHVGLFCLTISMLLLFLLVHYPFGAFNIGSATRYRENFYQFVMIILFACAFDRDVRRGVGLQGGLLGRSQ